MGEKKESDTFIKGNFYKHNKTFPCEMLSLRSQPGLQVQVQPRAVQDAGCALLRSLLAP